MNHILFLLAISATVFSTAPIFATSIQWESSLKIADHLSQSSQLPIYLLFSGPSWCIWCQRMDQEIHSQKPFIDKMQGKCRFVSIEVPAGGHMDLTTRQLFTQYNIQGLPTAILLSAEGKEIGRFGYTHINPEQYADIVLKTITSTK